MSNTAPSFVRKLHLRNFLFFTLTPLAAITLAWIHIANFGFSWGLMAFLLVSFVISNMSITCGYHRYFAHRSYQAHPVVEFLYAIVGAGAFQGSVLQWATDHRRHHLRVDTDEDPYSIKKGFWFAHIGWILTRDPQDELRPFAPDLAKKPLLQFQNRYYGAIASLVGFGLPGLVGWALGFGWGGLIFGGLVRVVLSEHSTFFINSLCHTIGRQPYSDSHSARDSLIMAICTFGEGYHNYHHEFQADYRNGIRWYHWDPTKWWIRSLSFIGLTSRLKRTPREEILRARISMDERLMLARGASAERVLQMKAALTEAALKIRRLRTDWAEFKASVRLARQQRNAPPVAPIRRLRLKVAQARARREFNTALQQWRSYARTLRKHAA